MKTCVVLFLGLVMLACASEIRPVPTDESPSLVLCGCEGLQAQMTQLLRLQEATAEALQLRGAKTASALQGRHHWRTAPGRDEAALGRRRLLLHERLRRMEKGRMTPAPETRDVASLELLEGRVRRLEAACDMLSTTDHEAPPATPSSLTSASASTAREQQSERARVLQRMEDVKRRWESARARPSPLGEALYEAARQGSLPEVQRLLDEGADVNYIAAAANSPLIAATASYSDSIPEVVSLLLDAGADVDARAENGATPLHMAADWDRQAAVRALLAGGARKDLKGWSGWWKNKTPSDVTKSEDLRNLLRPEK